MNEMQQTQKIIEEINKNKENIKIMHICGTHERTISQYGIRSILPKNISILSGPGCPVCVTPVDDIDTIIILAKKGFKIITYGDMLRVPGTKESLFDARESGANVEMVYSIDDAIKIANKNNDENIIFFAIGFETTIPTVANVIKKGIPKNMSIFTSLKLTPPAMEYLIKESKVDAFIAPGHVATITGIEPFRIFETLNYPVVISGFEMIDILQSIFLLILKLKDKKNHKKTKVFNEYKRCVSEKGNLIAMNLIKDVFDITDSEWRGIGIIKNSGLKIKDKYSIYDAKIKYKDLYYNDLKKIHAIVNKKNNLCICNEILTGKNTPNNCPMFKKQCNPKNPIGACMVSDEGMCFNWYKFRNS